jgi:hypothetical protein
MLGAGGTCTFSYGRSHWNLGEVLQGSLVFSPALAKPIVSARLVLYKIEIAEGDTQEKTVKELALFAPLADKKEGEVRGRRQQLRAYAATGAPAARTARRALRALHRRRVARRALGQRARGLALLQPNSAGQVSFSLQADPNGPSLGPTYDELNEEDASVNVHYYLRLLLEDSQQVKTWNTHEVILYRSKLTGVVATALDV